MLNRQETFDKVVKALREQGHQCRNAGGGYAYINSNGDKCAIGHLIPEKFLEKAAKVGDGIGTLLWEIPELIQEFNLPQNLNPKHYEFLTDFYNNCTRVEDFRFLRDLQDVHDEYSADEWEAFAFVDFAQNWGLTLAA